ncbi:MAG: tRNA lysidine(34) synthetase TilS [Bacteroidales bacterium]|nr:tRNA lysidine(34) synthetase TilS [Bacteroidales bacterium]
MLLLGVSGGIDSMCLAEKVRLSGEPFAVAHCNFSLRGDESDADEAFVREWCDKHGIQCHVRRFATSLMAKEQGISIEMCARKVRYHWFGQLCRQFGYDAVAVAHNANDNAETLLLNLLRGTGVKGILGMKASGFLPDPAFGDIPLLRPLLGMTRDDISAFAADHGVSFRNDSSNSSNEFKRNKIRNKVFPVFREINPRFVETLNRDMERFAEEMGPLPLYSSGGGQAPLRVSPPSVQKLSITEEAWDGTKEVRQPEGMLILDADKAGELVEGSWESGDWIRPLGAPGRKKMQDWFTDHHIPADEKPFVKLFKKAGDPHHVLAVAGYCIDHSVRVTKSTRRILRISVKND